MHQDDALTLQYQMLIEVMLKNTVTYRLYGTCTNSELRVINLEKTCLAFFISVCLCSCYLGIC